MSQDKKISFTPRKLIEHDQQIVGKTLVIFLAALMDELDMGADELNDVMERFIRYSDAIDEHLISVKQVIGIVKEQTGVDITWH